jgi:hypothetical protein
MSMGLKPHFGTCSVNRLLGLDINNLRRFRNPFATPLRRSEAGFPFFSTRYGRCRQGSILSVSPIGCYFFRMRTPGLSSLRNWMPAFSIACWTCDSVEVREPICPLKDSIRRIVPMATRERFASSICSQPSNTRAARNCLPVITKRP